MRTSHALLFAAAALSLAPIACTNEKSDLQKRAEEMAASASASQSAKTAPSADPKEEQYKKQKAAFEKTVANYIADLAHIMAQDSSATPGVLRQYFEAGAEGDKRAKEVETFYKDQGAKGYRIEGAIKIANTMLKGSMDEGEIEFTETRAAKSSRTCFTHDQSWKLEEEKWIFKSEKPVTNGACT